MLLVPRPPEPDVLDLLSSGRGRQSPVPPLEYFWSRVLHSFIALRSMPGTGGIGVENGGIQRGGVLHL
jgi:hypothetical protein